MSRSVALMIGNQDYAPFARPLQGPRGDAIRIARLLEDLGFDLLQPQFDADYDAIRKSVRAFAAALGHVDKWRSQRRIDGMSMNPRKLWAVLS